MTLLRTAARMLLVLVMLVMPVMPVMLAMAVMTAWPSPVVAGEAATQAIQPASVALEPATLPSAEPAAVTAIAPSPMPDQPATSSPRPAARGEATAVSGMLTKLLGTRSLDTTLSAAVMFGVASLAPAVLLMTTCFVRMSIVLTLVRQGLGTPQLPSNQILTSLALFLSALVMWPVWTAAYRDGVEAIRKATKDKKITEDDEKKSLDELQKLTDGEIKKMEDMCKVKEKEK